MAGKHSCTTYVRDAVLAAPSINTDAERISASIRLDTTMNTPRNIYTVRIELEVAGPAGYSADKLGDIIDEHVWELQHSTPVVVRESIVFCNEITDGDDDTVTDDRPDADDAPTAPAALAAIFRAAGLPC